MSEQKHTPGPWTVRPDEHDDWGLVRAADGYPVATAGVSARCQPWGQQHARVPREVWAQGPDDVAANARLIAAAPDLAEILKSITDCYGIGDSPDRFCANVEQFMVDARDLLKKAGVE